MSIACALCAVLVSQFGHSYLDFPVIHGKLSSTQYKSFLCIFSILSKGKTAALLANWKALGYETENFHDCIEETNYFCTVCLISFYLYFCVTEILYISCLLFTFSNFKISFHNWLLLCCFWRRKWQPTPVFLPGESQGQGSLVGCRLWGCAESDMTEVT